VNYEIKPRSLGEILDGTFQLYKNHFGVFASTALTFAVPSLLLWGLVNWFITGELSVDPGFSQERIKGDASALMPFLIGFASIQPFLFLLQLLQEATLTLIIADAYLGKSPNLGAAFQKCLGLLRPLVGAGILKGLGIFFGLICFVVPGIMLMMRWLFSTQAIALEGTGGRAGMARSRDLTLGERWRLFLIVLILGILTMAVSFGLKALVPDSIGDIPVLGGLLKQVPVFLLVPLGSAAITLAYFDARVKKEGFDLQVLSGSMPAGPMAPGTVHAP
jgi:hypothetical protein